MPENGNIRYLQRTEIDVAKWDECISTATNGLIYGYSFYLDALATNWHALVLNDYEAVMPLPWRKKWTIFYLYQPFLTAQLGVFGHHLSKELLAQFLRSVPREFQYWDLSLNHQNFFPIDGFPLYRRMNYVLPLNKPYADLYNDYRQNIRRNIRKSRDIGCSLTKDVDLNAIIGLLMLQGKEVPLAELNAFTKLFHLLKEKGMAEGYGIITKSGDLLASAAFLFSHKRAYYLLVGNHPNGRTLGASHALIDAFIHNHADKDMLLDFEGSDLRNLAFFYSSFGAREESYAALQFNRLPWWIRWMK